MSEIKDLLDRFRRGGDVLDAAAASVKDFDRAPNGKWTPRQIIAHVADAEVVWAMRFRQLIAEDHPTMPGWDQEKWTAKLDYQRRDPSQSLATFRQLRAENATLLDGLNEEDFARSGTHTTRGTTTIEGFLKLATDHAESHARQIREMNGSV